MKEKKQIIDIMAEKKPDRRLLKYVPDVTEVRSNTDRRKIESKELGYFSRQTGADERYITNGDVDVICKKNGKKTIVKLKNVDISATGTLLVCNQESQANSIKSAEQIVLRFDIEPGVMPEGYESKTKIKAKVVRERIRDDGSLELGMKFDETLSQHINRKQGRYLFGMSLVLFVFVSVFVVFMRAESIIYFRFNQILYTYSIIAAVFLLSRYFFGMLYRAVPINPDFTPSVTIIIPCFNEEAWIERTILSCVDQDYPPEKLSVIIVDDYSTDNSVEMIKKTLEKLNADLVYSGMPDRVSYFVQPENLGKRDALAVGTKMAKSDYIVFVDSDSFLDPYAIRNLVQPFQDPKMGGVAGRTDVANVYTNWLTKMQTTRYYVAFRIMKSAEAYFDTVTCLSGPLACYKKEIVDEVLDDWLNQEFLGRKATFGDDRSLTNFVLKKHRTSYQDTAICSTIVPNEQSVFLKQQMRWKRSWLRESFIAASFIWKKEPFAAIFFFIGLIVPFLAPIIVVYNLIYVPIVHQVFPTTFLLGLLMMALLMSFVYLLFRRSKIWLFSMFFVIYYEFVLLWQMPVAWFTFWKSTWGTRMTPEDVKEQERREQKKMLKEKGKVKNNA